MINKCSNIYLILIMIIIISNLFGQLTFEKHSIDSNIDGICSVSALDIDNDGFIDIVGAAWDVNEIAWWRNSGSDPITWEKRVLSNDVDGASFVVADDIDKDNDIDVIACGWDDHSVNIYYNQGSDPITWNKITIDNSFRNAHEVRTADIDNDGFTDIIGAASYSNTIAWWKNPGLTNSGNWTKNIVDQLCYQVRTVYPGDLNNDGRIDLVGASFSSNKIKWYMNNTDLTWTEYIVDNIFKGPHMVHLNDLNNDGFLDILAAGYAVSNQDVAYWLNDGSSQSTWTKTIIDGNFNGALGITSTDIDLDDDIDIISTSEVVNDIAIWVNSIDTNTWSKTIIEQNLSGAWALKATDLDLDGDIDIISGGNKENHLVWYENTSQLQLSIESGKEITNIFLNNFPNPFNPETIITYDLIEESDITINIYDIVGKQLDQIVASKQPTGTHSIKWNGTDKHGNQVPAGIYFYQLQASDYIQTKKMVLVN